jgi:chromosome segregation ATPase
VSKQNTEQINNVVAAEQTLHELQAKRERVVVRAAELAVERKDAAYSAHVEKNADARKRLDKVNAESAQHASELKSVEDAIATAQDRLQQARQHAARERERVNALALKKELATFCEMGVELDAALSDVVASAAEMRAALDRMHALGAGPTDMQFMVMGALATHTSLMQLPFRDVARHLAPNERKGFAGLIAEWQRMVERVIAERLGEGAETKEPEAA